LRSPADRPWPPPQRGGSPAPCRSRGVSQTGRLRAISATTATDKFRAGWLQTISRLCNRQRISAESPGCAMTTPSARAPPAKAEVTRSNLVGRANHINHLTPSGRSGSTAVSAECPRNRFIPRSRHEHHCEPKPAVRNGNLTDDPPLPANGGAS